MNDSLPSLPVSSSSLDHLPQGQAMARSIGEKLQELRDAVARAVSNSERSGAQQPAHTVAGQLEQAQRWLENPSLDDRGLGQQAIGLIVDEGRKVNTS